MKFQPEAPFPQFLRTESNGINSMSSDRENHCRMDILNESKTDCTNDFDCKNPSESEEVRDITIDQVNASKEIISQQLQKSETKQDCCQNRINATTLENHRVPEYGISSQEYEENYSFDEEEEPIYDEFGDGFEMTSPRSSLDEKVQEIIQDETESIIKSEIDEYSDDDFC
uniref:Uncharacterized protein n=1 Tax=Aplanochytrium stocchinoi TaxID=215587 RepID=A0A7S3LGP9_9STRA|mmetsp:Transcript_16377/g.19559  ORF Transcript_16377/g.19559 Transcript_16377/m.19559 type:complete len:171 (+) Transcript_16377:1512-2024(+)